VARVFKAVSIVLPLLVAVVSFAQTAPQSRIVEAIDDAQFTAIHGSRRLMAGSALDRGRLDGSTQLRNVSIVFKLSPAQQRELDMLLAQQQDTSSPNYHKWLTRQQYADRFGLTQADIAKVSGWLVSRGFTIDRVTGGRTQISFSGTAAQLESAFHTEIHEFDVDNEKRFANVSELSVPAALAGSVLDIRGLNNFWPKPRHTAIERVESSPRLNASGGAHLLAPEDFATIYDLKSLYDQGIDGTGQTIAVVGQIAVDMKDIDNFRAAAGLTKNDPTVVVVPGSGTPVFTDANDLAESDLDLEWSGAVAKNATILFVTVGPGGNGGAFDSLFWALDPSATNAPAPPLAQVISTSYGACEAANPGTFAPDLQAAIQAANSQGTTVTAAAGDSGAADCDGNVALATQGLAVDVPAAIPEVTSLGGTEFSADKSNPSTYWSSITDPDGGSALSYIAEGTWNDTSQQGTLAAGGGGISTLFPVPAWQMGVAGVLPAVVKGGGRNVPDVALNASNGHDPYLICSTPPGTTRACTAGFADANNQLGGVGGTSVGAPTFAGIVALLDQAINSAGLGNLNAPLYALAASSNGASAFHDITTGSNIVPCVPGKPASDPALLQCPNTGKMGYSAGPGYDQVSGLGSIDANNLVTNWVGFSPTPTYTMGGSPVTVASAGDAGTSTITLTGVHGFNGTVNLTCAPPSSTTVAITCSIPGSVTISSINATATLTINTSVAHAVLGSSSVPAHPRGRGWFAVTGGGMLVGVLMMGVPSRRHKSTVVFAVALVALIMLGGGCGGGSSTSHSIPVSPTGNFTVVVTAVSGSITRTLNVSVTVE
jgi:subtilase family serine protease